MWPPYQKSGSRILTLREPLWLSWLETFHMHCHRDPFFNCAPMQFHQQCPCYHIKNYMLDCYLWASNHQPFDYWRAHHVYYVASQPRTSDRLISHWRALCLLAHDNWRCSIQPEIFTHQNLIMITRYSWTPAEGGGA